VSVVNFHCETEPANLLQYYLSDCSTQLTVNYYFDNTDYKAQLILIYSTTPTCSELIADHQAVLHMMSYVLIIINTHADFEI
jgi:hypothetical protein